MCFDKVLILIGLYFHIIIATGEFYAENQVERTPYNLHVHLPLNWQFWWFWTIWTAFLCQIWSFSVTTPKQKLIYRSLEAELQWNKSNIATKITIDYHLASKNKKNLLLRDRKPLTLALVGYSRLDPNDKICPNVDFIFNVTFMDFLSALDQLLLC